MNLRMHPGYAALVAKAEDSHRRSRSPEGITPEDVALARLYAYAFRLHTIGAFHATHLALSQQPASSSLAMSHRRRALDALEDLQDQGMEPVPDDFRAVISTLHRYHRNIVRTVEGIGAAAASGDAAIAPIGDRFARIIEQITESNGICPTRDIEAPAQACFIVPNLGITIVPLVYGDHHSWNLAHLPNVKGGVPTHLHHHGVEIHLGFEPMRGRTVLGNACAPVEEGYAMPIPPQTPHGYVNDGDSPHHVPFVFGSLRHGGWGVFLDVEPVPRPIDQYAQVSRRSAPFSQMIYLERELARARDMVSSRRAVLIPATVTDRGGSGGLELAVARINERGLAYPVDDFRIISVVHGAGTVTIAQVTRQVGPHDHFGVPAGMKASLRQSGTEPLVALDALIRGIGRRPR